MDFMQSLIEAVREICLPAGFQPKFRICDTMGLGLPYDDVSLPRSIPRIFQALRAMGLPALRSSGTGYTDAHRGLPPAATGCRPVGAP